MMISAAYASVIAHVAMGVLQDDKNPLFPTVVVLSIIAVCGLHVVAGRRERGRRYAIDPLFPRGSVDRSGNRRHAIAEGHGAVIHLSAGEPVAIFRHQGRLSAISLNVCAHQIAPLGEGPRIIDGCVTCPWHAFQYRVEDGCSPPPFTERIATYRLAAGWATRTARSKAEPIGYARRANLLGELPRE